jgi:hypothetical protein
MKFLKNSVLSSPQMPITEFKTSLPTNALFIKMLQLTLKISLYMAPTCFSPFGPSSGSIHQNLAKVTVFVELLVKVHR